MPHPFGCLVRCWDVVCRTKRQTTGRGTERSWFIAGCGGRDNSPESESSSELDVLRQETGTEQESSPGQRMDGRTACEGGTGGFGRCQGQGVQPWALHVFYCSFSGPLFTFSGRLEDQTSFVWVNPEYQTSRCGQLFLTFSLVCCGRRSSVGPCKVASQIEVPRNCH